MAGTNDNCTLYVCIYSCCCTYIIVAAAYAYIVNCCTFSVWRESPLFADHSVQSGLDTFNHGENVQLADGTVGKIVAIYNDEQGNSRY
jgi:hypothetical protein